MKQGGNDRIYIRVWLGLMILTGITVSMAGMNLEEKEDMARFVLDVSEREGFPVVLIEHDMGVVMDIADRIVVINNGEVLAVGTPGEIGANPRVAEAYMGSDELW